jgi:hypothetical protein
MRIGSLGLSELITLGSFLILPVLLFVGLMVVFSRLKTFNDKLVNKLNELERRMEKLEQKS